MAEATEKRVTKKALLEFVDRALQWGDDVAEMWSGTLYEKEFDQYKAQIKDSIKKNDLVRTRQLLFDLTKFLDRAEREYNE